MKKRYEITYTTASGKEKTVTRQADDAWDAITNYGQEQFFGYRPYFLTGQQLIDADTRGEIWATGRTDRGKVSAMRNER